MNPPIAAYGNQLSTELDQGCFDFRTTARKFNRDTPDNSGGFSFPRDDTARPRNMTVWLHEGDARKTKDMPTPPMLMAMYPNTVVVE